MTFTNPVYGDNFADPQVVAVDGTYYAFATNGPLGNVQTLTSVDRFSWHPVGDALPQLPSWSSPGKVWAPEVAIHAPDRFVMYYTSSDDASGVQAIGVAVASDPKGPYVDKSSWPLICETDEGGSIDASPFQDSADGRDWFVYPILSTSPDAAQRPALALLEARVGSGGSRPGTRPDDVAL